MSSSQNPTRPAAATGHLANDHLLQRIEGRWILRILLCLGRGEHRFSDLRDAIPPINGACWPSAFVVWSALAWSSGAICPHPSLARFMGWQPPQPAWGRPWTRSRVGEPNPHGMPPRPSCF